MGSASLGAHFSPTLRPWNSSSNHFSINNLRVVNRAVAIELLILSSTQSESGIRCACLFVPPSFKPCSRRHLPRPSRISNSGRAVVVTCVTVPRALYNREFRDTGVGRPFYGLDSSPEKWHWKINFDSLKFLLSFKTSRELRMIQLSAHQIPLTCCDPFFFFLATWLTQEGNLHDGCFDLLIRTHV